MEHVDVHDCVGVRDGPRLAFDIQQNGRREVVSARGGAPGTDAREHPLRRVGRLPAKGRECRREESGVLPGAAGDFQHQPAGRQHRAQHVQDRPAVALRRCGMQTARRCGWRVEEGHGGVTACHVPWWMACAASPTAAAPSTSQVELVLNRSSRIALATAGGQLSAGRRWMSGRAPQSPPPSGPARRRSHRRGRWTRLSTRAAWESAGRWRPRTRTPVGKSRPSPPTRSPGPERTYPMKVAVVKTGPGVTCPTATASISCASVSQWSRCTRSARKKASRT